MSVMNLRRYIFLFFLSAVSIALVGQNSTASPYSRFGYGELNDNVPVQYRSMGGVGAGMRSRQVINPSQPASYSAVDTTSFMMDIGASFTWSNYRDYSGSKNKINGNLEYLTMQFPIWKYIGMSIGVMPYTSVGYDLKDSISDVPHPYITDFSGKGGFSQVYGGLSFNILNWVAVGANVYYMFGKIENLRDLSFVESGFTSVSQDATMKISDVRFRYGLQFFHTFKDKHYLVLGGTFENKSKLNGKYTQIETVSADTVVPNLSEGYELPMFVSAGASYCFDNRLTIALDYQLTDWKNAKYEGETGYFRSRNRYALGIEYRHNPMSKKYAELMPFRVGVCMSDSYIKSMPTKDWTVSIGFGFPLRNVSTVINTTVEYIHRGNKNTLEENALKLTISAGINEYWFFKRKL